MGADFPSIKHFFFPILRTLVDAGRALRRPEIARGAADVLRLDDAQRTVRIPSGKFLTYRHRTGWAINELKHANLLASPETGLWTVTDAGRQLVATHSDGLSDGAIAEIRRRIRAERAVGKDDPASATLAASEDEAESSPEEQIESAVQILRDSVATELLDRLKAADPTFFEHVVLEVLNKIGYGADRDALHHSGQSGDGGIDGIISLDRLGLEKVYVQAKRWQNTVGRPEIQGFVGALSGRRATKGIFITTSTFSREAREYSAGVSDTLVLLNGNELTGLMIDYSVGVSQQAVQIPSIDADYFGDS